MRSEGKELEKYFIKEMGDAEGVSPPSFDATTYVARSTISMSVVISVPDACLYVQILAK